MSPVSVNVRLPLLAALLVSLAVLSGCSSSGGPRSAAGTSDGVAEAGAAMPADPGEPVPERALASYGRALEAMRAFDWTEAELELEQLILAYPDYAGPHVNLAIVFMATERNADAKRALDQALTLNPQHAQAYNQLGILARREGRFADAEAAYREALVADPDYALAHYNLGVLLDLYLQRSADALAHYEAYQALLPEPDKTVAKWIVDLRRRLGMNKAAARVTPEEDS